jgi:hypothetical protein
MHAAASKGRPLRNPHAYGVLDTQAPGLRSFRLDVSLDFPQVYTAPSLPRVQQDHAQMRLYTGIVASNNSVSFLPLVMRPNNGGNAALTAQASFQEFVATTLTCCELELSHL